MRRVAKFRKLATLSISKRFKNWLPFLSEKSITIPWKLTVKYY